MTLKRFVGCGHAVKQQVPAPAPIFFQGAVQAVKQQAPLCNPNRHHGEGLHLVNSTRSNIDTNVKVLALNGVSRRRDAAIVKHEVRLLAARLEHAVQLPKVVAKQQPVVHVSDLRHAAMRCRTLYAHLKNKTKRRNDTPAGPALALLRRRNAQTRCWWSMAWTPCYGLFKHTPSHTPSHIPSHTHIHHHTHHHIHHHIHHHTTRHDTRSTARTVMCNTTTSPW